MTVASAVSSGSPVVWKTGRCVEDNAHFSSITENADGCQVKLSGGGGETEDSSRANCAVAGSDCGDGVAVGTCFLLFLSRLRRVCEGCGRVLVQYSSRSTFSELF